MIYYVKTALHEKRTGAFKANAVLCKLEDGAFSLVYKAGQASFAEEFCVSPNTRDFITSNEELRVVNLYPTPMPEYSFVTVMHDPRIAGDVLGNLELRFCDETVHELSSSVDFDSLFAAQQAATATIAGIAIKTGYTQNVIYTGFGSYHGHVQRNRFNTPLRNDKPYRIGVELEVYANNEEAFNTITRTRSNWFQCEGDGSLTERSNSIEIKTIPLKPCDATSVDFWNDPMLRLKTLAKSKGFSTTGLHVHISKEILGSDENTRQKNLSKLIWFYTYFVEDDPVPHQKNVVICGRERGYHAENPKTPKGDWAKDVGLKKFAEGPYINDAMDDVKARVRSQRSDINIGRWDSYGTIEFRKGKGAISRTRLAAICTWWEQMCLYCVRTNPRDFDFNDFFNAVVRDYPAVAYFFNADEEV